MAHTCVAPCLFQGPEQVHKAAALEQRPNGRRFIPIGRTQAEFDPRFSSPNRVRGEMWQARSFPWRWVPQYASRRPYSTAASSSSVNCSIPAVNYGTFDPRNSQVAMVKEPISSAASDRRTECYVCACAGSKPRRRCLRHHNALHVQCAS